MDIFRSGKQDVYIAVAERYERYIKSEVLKSGDKLPSVRVAAEELGVNPNTVQKAYTLLESRGLIYSIPKKGAFVCSSDPDKRKGEAYALAYKSIGELRDIGIEKETVINILEEVYGSDQN